MQQTIATYRSRSSGKVRVHGYLTLNGEWIIDRAFDEDKREVSVPDFETTEASEELALQALQDAIDAEHERDWLRDCGDTLDAMSDDDLDAFALELVRVVPALRRTSVAANDVSRDWSEAA